MSFIPPRTFSAPLSPSHRRSPASAPRITPTLSPSRTTPVSPGQSREFPSHEPAPASRMELPLTSTKPPTRPPSPEKTERSPAAIKRTPSDPALWKSLYDCVSHIPPPIKTWAMEMWDDVANTDPRPAHMKRSPRSDLFGGISGRGLLKERKLSNQVLGILSRVTPEKFEMAKEQLLQLPIRQSDDDEINEVVRVFFTKSINPADSIYTPQYTSLFASLIAHITELEMNKERKVSNTIRTALVVRCKEQFDENFFQTLSGSVHNNMTQEKRESHIKHLKANVTFLGQLFINGLVKERVVLGVLYNLLYGAEKTESVFLPQDYEMDQFASLLIEVGPSLSPKSKHYVREFGPALQEISRLHPHKRIQFKALDLLDLLATEDLTSKRLGGPTGPMKLHELAKAEFSAKMQEKEAIDRAISNQQERPRGRRGGMGSGFSPTSAAPRETEEAAPRYMAFQDFRTAMNLLVEGTENLSERTFADIPRIPPAELVRYLVQWSERFLKTIRLEKERQHLGSAFGELIAAKAADMSMVREIFRQHARQFVTEKLFEDNPLYYRCWVDAVVHGAPTLTPSFHTIFLSEMVRASPPFPVKQIHLFIQEVVAKQPPETAQVQRPRDLVHRFRVLPMVLRYTTLVIPNGDEEDDEEEEETADILDSDVDIHPEMTYFRCLVCGVTVTNQNDKLVVDGPNGKTGKARLEALLGQKIGERSMSVSAILQLVCAVFTYGRFEEVVMRTLLESVKTLTNGNRRGSTMGQLLLMEAYCTWKDLDRQPRRSLQTFFRLLLEHTMIKDGDLRDLLEYVESNERDKETVSMIRELMSE